MEGSHACARARELSLARGWLATARRTERCKTVAGLYFNLIHGSGNRKDRSPRRWLKTGTWESYEVPDETRRGFPLAPVAENSSWQDCVSCFSISEVFLIFLSAVNSDGPPPPVAADSSRLAALRNGRNRWELLTFVLSPGFWRYVASAFCFLFLFFDLVSICRTCVTLRARARYCRKNVWSATVLSRLFRETGTRGDIVFLWNTWVVFWLGCFA